MLWHSFSESEISPLISDWKKRRLKESDSTRSSRGIRFFLPRFRIPFPLLSGGIFFEILPKADGRSKRPRRPRTENTSPNPRASPQGADGARNRRAPRLPSSRVPGSWTRLGPGLSGTSRFWLSLLPPESRFWSRTPNRTSPERMRYGPFRSTPREKSSVCRWKGRLRFSKIIPKYPVATNMGSFIFGSRSRNRGGERNPGGPERRFERSGGGFFRIRSARLRRRGSGLLGLFRFSE